MRSLERIPVVVLTLLLVSITLELPNTIIAASRRGPDVQIYTLQVLVNQAFQMVLEGSNLVMLDQMDRGGVFGESMSRHGWTMIEEGRRIISGSMAGDEMKQLVRDGKDSDPVLLAVKENAAEILNAVEVMTSYLRIKIDEPALSRMHSLFTLHNHGMKMATEGANMILLGRTGEQGGAKETLQKHGRSMMRDSRVLIITLSDNDTMKELHQAGHTIEKSPAMASLHRVIEHSLRIIDRLARM